MRKNAAIPKLELKVKLVVAEVVVVVVAVVVEERETMV